MTESRIVIPPPLQDACGIILAGGRNSRMGGAPKALLRVGGETVLERSLRLLQRCFPRVIVVANDPERYAGLAAEVIVDEIAVPGPLAGIHAGLGRIHTPHAFVVACDMPFLREEPLRYLAARRGHHDAVVPIWDGDVEPLHAFYATRLRDRIEGLLARGSGAVRDLLREIDVRYVPETELRVVQGAEESFRNVNTPEEAARYALHP